LRVAVLNPWVFMRRWPIIPAIVLTTLIVVGAFAPFLERHDPYKGRTIDAYLPPAWYAEGSMKYPLGTDHVGRDILDRIIQGARLDLMVVSISLFCGLIIGCSIGITAGYLGGWWDEIIMRLVDVWYSVPYMMIALVVVILFGQSFGMVMGLLVLFSWVGFVRVTRANTLSVKSADYISLARIAGASHVRLLLRHIVPMVVNSAVVLATLNVGGLILLEGTLSFIGVGIPSPNPAWGTMIAEGRGYISMYWWMSFFPGVAMFLVVMSLNFMGDWLRDRLDPRLRQL
jgi:peptide/nickel transport system permease protein